MDKTKTDETKADEVKTPEVKTDLVKTDEGAETKPKSIEEAIAAGVENWINDNLRSTVFSRDTLVWNKLQAALPNLTGAILKEVN